MCLSCCDIRWNQQKSLVDHKRNVINSYEIHPQIKVKPVQEDVVDSPKLPKRPQIKKTLCRSYLETMKSKKNRLDSFEGKWPLPFISMADLAEAGFFYLQLDDRVQCAFCNLILHSWQPKDQPWKEHKDNSPNCTIFATSSSTTVKPPERRLLRPLSYTSTYVPLPANTSSFKPNNPYMADVKNRLLTFQEWPFPISAKELADCGFYYAGYEDYVTCFSCGKSHGHWEPTDDPFIEHSRYYPDCRYLRLLQTRRTSFKKQSAVQSNATKNALQSVRHALVEEFLKSDVVKEAKEIFPASLVQTVVYQHLLETGQTFSSLSQLIDKVLVHDEKEIKRSNAPKNNHASIIPQQNKVLPVDRHSASSNMADVLLCKICMDEQISMVFQPCRHFVTCEKCAWMMDECPLCREKVTSREKIFLG